MRMEAQWGQPAPPAGSLCSGCLGRLHHLPAGCQPPWGLRPLLPQLRPSPWLPCVGTLGPGQSPHGLSCGRRRVAAQGRGTVPPSDCQGAAGPGPGQHEQGLLQKIFGAWVSQGKREHGESQAAAAVLCNQGAELPRCGDVSAAGIGRERSCSDAASDGAQGKSGLRQLACGRDPGSKVSEWRRRRRRRCCSPQRRRCLHVGKHRRAPRAAWLQQAVRAEPSAGLGAAPPGSAGCSGQPCVGRGLCWQQ